MLTDEQLDAIEARCNAATPGPWEFYDGALYRLNLETRRPIERVLWMQSCYYDYDPDAEWGVYGKDEGELDSAFIESARDDVPALLAEVRRLREIAEKLTAIPVWRVEGDQMTCLYCRAAFDNVAEAVVEHAPDCPWAMARAWKDGER